MKRGDRLQVIDPKDLMFGEVGTFQDLTRDGYIVMRFERDVIDIAIEYHPQQLENVPVTLWEFAGITGFRPEVAA